MSLIDLFREFQGDAIQHTYPPMVRTLFDVVLYELNRAYWPDEIVLSERRLTEMTGLSKTGVNKAKRFLADAGWLKVINHRRGTGYSIGDRMSDRTSDRNGDRNGDRRQDNSALKQINKTERQRRRAREESAEYEQPEESGIDLSEY